MRVLVCPTEFKESLSVGQVVEAMSSGVLRAHPTAEIRHIPVSDGGPGLLESLRSADGGEIRTHEVLGPLGRPVIGRILTTVAGEAVIESADACGLHLVPPDRRDPLTGDTRGVGELLNHALDDGAERLVIGLGGSGTVDGGTGMATAFGYRFLGAAGNALPPGGGPLVDLASIVSPAFADTRAARTDVIGITDVRTPMTGPDGAAATFGPQKGAGPDEVAILGRGLDRLADRILADLGRDVARLPGSGAAGGLAGGCVAFLGSRLCLGSEWLLERVGFDEALSAADLVVTGEGAFDATSGLGKVVGEIVRRATVAEVPVVLACGRISGALPTGIRAVEGGDAWLAASDVAHMVAEAAG